MKKLFFFATLIAATAFGLTSCSDSNGGDSPSGGDGEGQAYIAIRLNNVGTVPGMGSKPFLRASTVTGYENGTAAEGNVTKARFYFFNSDGSPYLLTSTTTEVNYKDVDDMTTNEVKTGEAPNQTDGDKETVERKTEAVLVINGVTNALPARVAVVANYDQLADDVLGSGRLSETELAALTRTTTKYAGANDNLFVMSNSVYLDETPNTYSSTSNSPLVSTPIDAKYFKPTPDAAKGEPVSIYVERVAARVDLPVPTTVAEADGDAVKDAWLKAKTIDASQADGVYAYKLDMTKSANKLEYITANDQRTVKSDKQLYVVVKGWGLADENNNGAIIKTLAQKYDNLATDAQLDANPMSVAAYHRSFWETKSAYATNRYSFNNYIGATTAERYQAPALGTAFGKQFGGKAYTFPNTGLAATDTLYWNGANLRREAPVADKINPTKVVVAAQLMYVEGGKLVPANISTYRNRHYLSEADVKTVIASDVNHSILNNIYVKTTAADGKISYRSLSTDDFEFVTGTAGTAASYKLTPTLKTLPDGQSYAKREKDESSTNDETRKFTDYTTQAQAQAALEAVTGTDITIYTAGDTYYYTTLQHIWMPTVAKEDYAKKPDNVGAWGVVRNHLYRVSLTGLTGWGTPVYKPNDEIIPITPTDENVYLGAQINVLQWRVVDQEANIDATPIVTNPKTNGSGE